MKGKTKFAIPINPEVAIMAGAEFEVICENGDYYSCRFLDDSIRCLYKSSVIITDCTPIIDWEQRRFELAKAAMQGLLNATSVERFTLRIKPSTIADASIEYADALIKELKK